MLGLCACLLAQSRYYVLELENTEENVYQKLKWKKIFVNAPDCVRNLRPEHMLSIWKSALKCYNLTSPRLVKLEMLIFRSLPLGWRESRQVSRASMFRVA